MAARRLDLAVQDDAALMGDPAQRDAWLTAAARGGAKYVRANVYYGQTQGGRDLSKVDALVNAARQRGLRVQATLSGDPDYLHPAGGLSYKNTDPRLMAQFARTVASHERGRIGRYSIWNEPNYKAFLADQNPRTGGRAYRNLYRAGRGAIKSVDPNAEVLLGEITSQPNAGAFLKSVLAGKPLRTEGVAYHPYAGGGSWDVHSLPALQQQLAGYARQGKLRTTGGNAAPLYLTEMGYQRGDVPEAQRQKQLQNYVRLAGAAGAREALLYQIAPTPTPPPDAGLAETTDAEGQVVPGRAPRAAGWKWDTAAAPAGPAQLESLVRLLTGAGSARRR